MIWTLIKGQLKKDRPKLPKLNTKNLLGALAGLILMLVLFVLIGAILVMVTNRFISLRLGDVYLTFIFFILLVVLCIYETSLIVKELFMSKDNELYFKLPVKKETIFLSKIFYIYLKQSFISLLFLAATAGLYGYLNPETTGAYYIRLLFITLVFPMIPLIIATILSIPMSYLMKIMKKNKALLLVSVLVIIGVFFVSYMIFIQTILDLIQMTSNGSYIDQETQESIRNSIQYFQVSQLFYDILMNVSLVKNIIIVGLSGAVLSMGSYVLLKRNYFSLVDAQNQRVEVAIHPLRKAKGPYRSLVSKELKMMVRNPNIAFQAIILNVLMPLFVLLTVKLTSKVGVAQVGDKILAGIALLTMLVFILLSNSFQGQLISREKESFYISKMIPLPYFKQLMTRLSIGLMMSGIIIVVTSLLLFLFGFLSIIEALLVLVISSFFLIGYSTFLVAADYQNPKLSSYSSGFEESMSLFTVLFVGLVLAILMGASLSILTFFPNVIAKHWMYLSLVLVALIYGAFGVFHLRGVVKKR